MALSLSNSSPNNETDTKLYDLSAALTTLEHGQCPLMTIAPNPSVGIHEGSLASWKEGTHTAQRTFL